MKAKIYVILVMGIFSLLGSTVSAQEVATDSAQYRMVMTNGNVFIGKILEITPTHILFLSKEVGEIKLKRSDIKQQQMIEPSRMVNGSYWPRLPHTSRYFFTSTSYNLKKGEGNYQNIWVLFNNLSYGLTDYISIGAGLVPTFLFGTPSIPLWVSGKVGYPLIENKLGIGVISYSLFVTGVSGYASTVGPFVTYGNEDRNATFGMIWGFSEGRTSNTPLINLSGKFRVNRKSYLMAEMFTIDPDVDPFITFGLRTMFSNTAWDFNLTYFGEDGSGIFFPIIGLSIPFGKYPR